jgi:MFS family permease
MGTLYSLMQFCFAPIWGAISDRVGRRPIILLSVFGSFLSYLLFGLANSLAVLLLSRALAGIMAANLSTAQAYVADVTGPENRARGMGIIGAAFGLGFVFGPVLGFAVHRLGYNPAFLAAGLSLLDFFLALALLPESRVDRRAPVPKRALFRGGAMWAALRDPKLGPLIQVFFLSTFAFAGMEWTLTLFLMRQFDYTRDTTYLIFTYVGLVVAFVQGGLVGRLAKKGGEVRLIVTGLLCMAVGLALLPETHSLAALLAVLAILALGSGISSPSISSLVSKIAGSEEHGATLGVTQGFSSLARALGPYWGGRMFDIGLRLPFLTGGGFMLLAFLISLRLLAYKPTQAT